MTKTTKTTSNTQIFPYSIGFDCGNGIIKAMVSGHGLNDLPIRFPAYFLDVTNCAHDHDPKLTIQYIKAGENTGDKAKELETNQSIWLVGDNAQKADAERRVQVFGDKNNEPGKVRLCLPLLLSMVQHLPESKLYHFRVAASVHDADAFGEDIKNAIKGEHLIKVGERLITVVIHVIKIFNEGEQFKPVGDTSTTVLDLGNGTSIVSRFDKTGLKLNRQTPIQIGVQNLYKILYSHPEFRKLKGSMHDNRVMDLIRLAVEKADTSQAKPIIKYGFSKDAPDITDIYKAALKSWVTEYINRMALRKAISYA